MSVGDKIIVGKWECIVTRVTTMGYQYKLVKKIKK